MRKASETPDQVPVMRGKTQILLESCLPEELDGEFLV
jgi:hypothetical protein